MLLFEMDKCKKSSELNCSAAVFGLSTMIYKLVSSANYLILEPIFTTISLMKARKINGPRMDPCGTLL